MTAIDLVIVLGFFVSIYLIYYRNPNFSWFAGKRGFLMMFVGLGLSALFFLFDLAVMHLFPLFIPLEKALAVMEKLHLNYNWLILPPGVFLMLVGAAIIIDRYANAAIDIEHSHQRLEDELGARKKIEKSLAQAQRVAKLGNWDWDMVTNDLWWSDEIYRIFGLKPQQFGANYSAFLETIHPDDRTKVEEAVNRAVNRGVDYDIKHRIITPKGEVRIVHERGEVIRDKGGKPLSMLGTVQDITERERLEEMARRADRIETVGQLAGGMAHDFNNLLAVIYGNIGLLKIALTNEEKIDRKEILALTEKSLGASKIAADLIKRLLAFSRQQTLAPKKFSVNESLENMLELLTHSLGETITIELDAPKQSLKVQVDPGQFENAVLNLALNARDAMPDGGCLTLRAKGINIKERRNDPEDLQPGDYVLITVADTGTGMPKETLDKVLEPFFTTKEVGKGSGLGLSSVFGFVKQSHGHLSIGSEVGKGTIIDIYLPRVDGPLEKKPAKIKRELKPFEISGKILVVEDDPEVRAIVSITVKKLGFDVKVAANAKEAFQLIEKDTSITFLLSDIVMPGGMLGTDLALKAREVKPSLPILLMTGYAEYLEGEKRPSIKGIKIMQKPFLPEDLAEQITLTCQEFGERVPAAFKT